MARPRRSAGRDYAAEYARRQARAKAQGLSGYYEQRIARATAKRPGISRAMARGHRSVKDLLNAIDKAPPGTQISFMGLDRQNDGTWRRASILILAGDGTDETEYVVGPKQLDRLPEIGDTISDAGLPVLGAEYMQGMVDWATSNAPGGGEEESFEDLNEVPVFAFWRRGRWFIGFDRVGRVRTVERFDHRVVTIEGFDAAEAYYRRRGLEVRGFTMEAV